MFGNARYILGKHRCEMVHFHLHIYSIYCLLLCKNMSDNAQKSTLKRSAVWQYFVETEPGKVSCQLCNTKLVYRGGSTGTMSNHLKYKHKTMAASLLASSPARGGTVQASLKLKQPSITAFKTPVMSRDKWIRATTKLAEFCARDLRPISLVEGDGFKNFMHEVAPDYKLPGATTVGKYVGVAYQTKKKQLENLLSLQTDIALTTDMWTSVGTDGYITLTAHFIDEQWTYRNYVLATKAVYENIPVKTWRWR